MRLNQIILIFSTKIYLVKISNINIIIIILKNIFYIKKDNLRL